MVPALKELSLFEKTRYIYTKLPENNDGEGDM